MIYTFWNMKVSEAKKEKTFVLLLLCSTKPCGNDIGNTTT